MSFLILFHSIWKVNYPSSQVINTWWLYSMIINQTTISSRSYYDWWVIPNNSFAVNISGVIRHWYFYKLSYCFLCSIWKIFQHEGTENHDGTFVLLTIFSLMTNNIWFILKTAFILICAISKCEKTMYWNKSIFGHI